MQSIARHLFEQGLLLTELSVALGYKPTSTAGRDRIRRLRKKLGLPPPLRKRPRLSQLSACEKYGGI